MIHLTEAKLTVYKVTHQTNCPRTSPWSRGYICDFIVALTTIHLGNCFDSKKCWKCQIWWKTTQFVLKRPQFLNYSNIFSTKLTLARKYLETYDTHQFSWLSSLGIGIASYHHTRLPFVSTKRVLSIQEITWIKLVSESFQHIQGQFYRSVSHLLPDNLIPNVP